MAEFIDTKTSDTKNNFIFIYSLKLTNLQNLHIQQKNSHDKILPW